MDESSSHLSVALALMAIEEEKVCDPMSSKAVPSPKSQPSPSCPPDQQQDTTPSKKIQTGKDFILSVARNYSSEPVQNSDHNVWGVLTAISNKSRKRQQGINILLTADEHFFGRSVEDKRFRIDSNAISSSHCKIYRKKIIAGDIFHTSVFLKDTSTNGSYINWEKLNKDSPEAMLQHGDIVSFAAAPQHGKFVFKFKENELAYAFVYREVSNSLPAVDSSTSKRKAEEFVSENKRLKGIGIGAPEGPISLDDVRSLQRSNTDLRKQLESHVVTIQTMQDERRSADALHENEVKLLKETISQSYHVEIKDLRCMLDEKQKELVRTHAMSAERQQAMEDLNERLRASLQSRTDADEIINRVEVKIRVEDKVTKDAGTEISWDIVFHMLGNAMLFIAQKGTISELEKQLDEERNQRKKEREKALADQKSALQRAQLEAQEELKRQSDIASRQERELKEVISKLQESDKESRSLVEALRSKLEDTRESLVLSEKKVRQLESQVQDEQQSSAKERKKTETLEHGMKQLKKELEDEKMAREEAWAKVSALELEIAAAIRDLSTEKQRFQGARERIILRETQLRAFYSTTEEISSLFAKQQEQLKAMQKTLEDEDNYENMSVDIDHCATRENTVVEKVKSHRSNTNVKESSAASTPRVERIQVESSSDEASVTEKHECDMKSQGDGHHTQEQECTSGERAVNGGFGSDINGIDTAPMLDGDPIETERVLGTESPANFDVGNIDLNKQDTFMGDTMQLDNDTYVQEDGGVQRVFEDSARCSQSNKPLESLRATEDTEGATATIRTADLLTSEVAGSWAISTAPSVYGENESPGSGERGDGGSRNNGDDAVKGMLGLSDNQAAGSQTIPVTTAATKWSQDRQALNAMIDIVAPEFKEQFGGNGLVRVVNSELVSVSDSDTDDGNSDTGVKEVEANGGSISDEDTQEGSDESHSGDNDNQAKDGANDCNDATQEDSLG
ncbi:hypothetical protein Scep_006350 [Stephania cephalantha]|uniref:FHA domain-containing protein n=1 Tax=Stephania cephalantha TaxID=152367 RepID=A0AAP0PK01_9MAGN